MRTNGDLLREGDWALSRRLRAGAVGLIELGPQVEVEADVIGGRRTIRT